MRIGFCQLESKCGKFEENLKKVVHGLRQADDDRVQVIAFPESFLTGYTDSKELAYETAFAVDSPRMMMLLNETAPFDATLIVGFNELRGDLLFNTAAVIQKGHLLGLYSKCTAYMSFESRGRSFPVFERNGVKFGVVICSDGGFIEPSRILAAQGAKIIFAPHFNYIGAHGLIGHFQHVRADHIARAVENGVYFVRANNVVQTTDPAITSYTGVGYGDSYIIDPLGEIVIRSRRHVEDFVFTDIDPNYRDRSWGVGRSLFSFREFGRIMSDLAYQPEVTELCDNRLSRDNGPTA